MVLFNCLSVSFAWTLYSFGEGDDEDDEKDVDDGGASERKLQRRMPSLRHLVFPPNREKNKVSGSF